MKFLKFIILVLSTVLTISCSGLKTPEYVGVKDINVSKIVNDSITINAALQFNNPNQLGGMLVLKNMHAEVNAIDLGFLKNQELEVPAKKEFLVPLELKLSYGQLFDSKKGLLGTLLTSILTNEVEVKLDGNAVFKKFLIKKTYPIQFSKKVKIVK